jgi:methyl-accepting chemotaxis protein
MTTEAETTATGGGYNLAELRGTVDTALTATLWLHVPMIGFVAWTLGNSVLTLSAAAAAVAGAATMARFTWPSGPARWAVMGVGLVAIVSLLVAAAAGGRWQGDIHMYYFAVLAVLSAYCDRTIILVSAAVTAIHHLVLNFLAPALVFDGGGDLGRVLLHAAILLVETGALVWLTDNLARLFRANSASLAAAELMRTREAELSRDESRITARRICVPR